jgi:ribosome maturation factor RimP
LRFSGETARVKLRVPQDGRRNFVGVLRRAGDGKLELEVDGELLEMQISNIDKARLVPRI